MPDGVLVIHQNPSVAVEVKRAFAGTELTAYVVETLDLALDYICGGGKARIVFYDGDRPEVAWGFRRAQEANPALLSRLLIAISPLPGETWRRTPRTHDLIDGGALLLIARQLCLPDVPTW
jgi:hypothetical protein